MGRAGHEVLACAAGHYFSGVDRMPLTGCAEHTAPDVYFEKIRVFKAGVFAVNTLAWNNKTGLWSCFVGFNDRSND